MIAGIGTDLCKIDRIADVHARFGERFLRRLLTSSEREEGDWSADKLARRWAMKEAVAKAFGVGIGAAIGFGQIEIQHNENGQPVVLLSGLDAGFSVWVSVSDDTDYAVAFAVVERA